MKSKKKQAYLIEERQNGLEKHLYQEREASYCCVMHRAETVLILGWIYCRDRKCERLILEIHVISNIPHRWGFQTNAQCNSLLIMFHEKV